MNALSWIHQVAVVEDPADHPLVKQIVAGTKQILAHRVTKKEPITTEILHKLVKEAIDENPELPAVRTITICLLGYAGFLCFDEIASLKEYDVNICNDHMEVFVESSKTDQFREVAWVPITRTHSKVCPVAMMERYFRLGECTRDNDKHLFRGLSRTKKGYRLRPSGSSSYTRVRELVLERIKAIGLDPRQFGLHSLRSGGASAVANAGVVKCYGQWHSENAKDGYIKDKLEDRLSVSKNISLA